MRINNRAKSGFTFLEIMFVVVIIGILASIVAPRLVGKTKKAKIFATKATMNGVKTALQQYEMNVGAFPTTDQGLGALLKCPSDVQQEDWDSKYFDNMPKDTWGQTFIYKCPGEHNTDYDLYSKGPDRQEDTDDDIVNWQKEEEEL